jgi:hypothetical protein
LGRVRFLVLFCFEAESHCTQLGKPVLNCYSVSFTLILLIQTRARKKKSDNKTSKKISSCIIVCLKKFSRGLPGTSAFQEDI